MSELRLSGIECLARLTYLNISFKHMAKSILKEIGTVDINYERENGIQSGTEKYYRVMIEMI